jgi:hypothetical protein
LAFGGDLEFAAASGDPLEGCMGRTKGLILASRGILGRSNGKPHKKACAERERDCAKQTETFDAKRPVIFNSVQKHMANASGHGVHSLGGTSPHNHESHICWVLG